MPKILAGARRTSLRFLFIAYGEILVTEEMQNERRRVHHLSLVHLPDSSSFRWLWRLSWHECSDLRFRVFGGNEELGLGENAEECRDSWMEREWEELLGQCSSELENAKGINEKQDNHSAMFDLCFTENDRTLLCVYTMRYTTVCYQFRIIRI